MISMRTLLASVGTAFLALTLATVVPAQTSSSPQNDDEQELEQVEGDVISLQRSLHAAQARGDDPEEVNKLQKKFDKLQKRRIELLRSTWQM